MNWKTLKETAMVHPDSMHHYLFEEGSPRRSSQMQRYLKLGAAGEVRPLLGDAKLGIGTCRRSHEEWMSFRRAIFPSLHHRKEGNIARQQLGS